MRLVIYSSVTLFVCPSHVTEKSELRERTSSQPMDGALALRG